MIIGTGIDIVEVDRIRRAINSWNCRFLRRVYTSNEINYCRQKNDNCFPSFAGYFSAKEAWAKAIGAGIYGIRWKEIEIKKDDLGKPYIQLSGLAQEMANKKGVTNTHLSISHTRELVIAQVVLEGLVHKKRRR